VTTIEEMAALCEKDFGKKVEVTRDGSIADLETELAKIRGNEDGRILR
jgi:hypothetical protein